MRRTRLAVWGAALGVAVATSFAGSVQAHEPGANDCDDWNRAGHGTPSHHHEYPDNDVAVGGPDDTYVHNHGGHYAVRGNSGYVEVVGGQGYNMDGAQGGYVQGAFFTPDGGTASFHTHFFENGKGRICVGYGQKFDVDE